jgi:hypothetical protein
VKNKKRKTKQTKIRSDNKIQKISERYRRSVEKGKEKASKDLDKLLDDLNQYYGKRGKLLKSKVKSEKQRKKYNDLLKEIEKYSSKAKRSARTAETQVSETASKLANYFGMTGEHAAAAAEIFVRNTMPIAARGYKPSQVVLILAEAGFDADAIDNILNYIERDLEFSTPDEMRTFREEDDIYMFVSHMANLKELDPEIPVEDIIKLADQMTRYDLDDYDNVVRWYWKDHNIWDDEEDEEE